MQRRLLIAARDVRLRATLSRVLGPAGYAVELADGPKRASEIVAGGNVALAIIEPSGFGEAGRALLRELRSAVARLIIISAGPQKLPQGNELPHGNQLPQGNKMEADAYVSQPVDPQLVLGRVSELLSKPESEQRSASAPRMIMFEGYALDLAGRTLRDPAGQNISLTAAQFTLLATLASHPGQVLSRDQISEAVAGREATPFDRSVDVLISRLRRKIEPDLKAPRLIVTVPGAGYKLAARTQVVTAPQSAPGLTGVDLEPATSGKPAIGVVPFNVIGADQHCSVFAQGLAEDLISTLVQGGFAISAVRSTNGQNPPDLQRVAQESHVRYLIMGSVRRIGERLRVTAQLMQGDTGNLLWAERYDDAIGEVLAVHDTVSEKIASGVTSALRNRRGDRARPRNVERRQLTIMSCEILGIARLATGLDPEELRTLTASFHRCCTETIGRFGGVVMDFTGDAMLACFGYPQAQEHDAEQAVRAGLALIDVISRLGDAPVLLRLGIATGPVVVGDLVGRGEPEDGGVIGETRNLATALRRTAKPNTIAIAPSTRRLTGDLFECRELESVDVDGNEDASPAWEVLRPSSLGSRFEALHGSHLTPLVGRDEELEILLRHWRHAKGGEMRVLLVTGEPGIGKSRLSVALQDLLRHEQHTCLLYFCSPHYQDSALYPAIRQLEGAAGFEHNDTAETKVAKLTALLAPAATAKQDLPLLAELLALPAGRSVDSAKLTPRQKREMTLEALIRQVDGLARQRPVLMIFEDAHWIDPTSGEFVDLVIERLAHRPVLLLITFRPEFQSPWTGKANVTTLTLNRLARRDSTVLIRRVVGDDALPSDLVDEIVDRTDGVPLFLEELSKAVLEANRDRARSTPDGAGRPALTVPATLHGSLMARLDRLDQPAKEVAEIGAAIGREFSYELVAAVAGRPDPEIAKALEGLVDSGLAFGRGAAPDTVFLFKHGLVRDAAYSMLSRRKCRQLHARIATVLEQQLPDIADREPAVVAHHCTEAGLVAKAITYWGRAGRKSVTQASMVEAAVQLRKGLDLVTTLPANAEQWRQEFELQTALGAALLASQGHGAPEVGEVYARARALGERLGEAEALVPILGGQFSFHLQRSEYAPGRQIAEKLLRLADERDDLAGRVVGHRAMGVCMHQLGAFASAATHFDQVLELYAPEEHQSIAAVAGFDPRAAALRYRAFGQLICGHCDQALSRMHDMMRWSRTLGHPYIMVHALNWMASFHLLRGDLVAAVAPLEELLALADPKFPLWLSLGQINRGWLLAQSGEPGDGLVLARKGFETMIAIGSTWNQTYYRGMLAQICEWAARPGEAMDELVTALSIADETGEQWFEPELRRLMGEWVIRHRPSALPDAEAHLQRAIAVAREQNAKMWELRATTSLVHLWAEQGRLEEARATLAPIFAWFTEGLDLPDRRAAGGLLGELERLLPSRRSKTSQAGLPGENGAARHVDRRKQLQSRDHA
jgi:DNA-binding response OmpR family regulator/class 3 adenylate cyclase/predicted ATPase